MQPIRLLFFIVLISFECIFIIVSEKRRRKGGKIILTMPRKFNIYLFNAILFFFISILVLFVDDFNKFLSVVQNASLAAIWLYLGLTKSEIRENGIVTHQGTWKWSKIENYQWIQGLHLNKCDGLKLDFQVNKPKKKIRFSVEEKERKYVQNFLDTIFN